MAVLVVSGLGKGWVGQLLASENRARALGEAMRARFTALYAVNRSWASTSSTRDLFSVRP
jgi:hypothetical protein